MLLMLCLIMRRGPTPGAIFELAADEISIGRGIRNHIVIHDNEVSREHCRLVRLLEGYELHDLQSSNGTFVNGQRVMTTWQLNLGTLIELGDTITLEYTEYDPQQGEALSPADAQYAAHLFNPNAVYGLMMTMGPAIGYMYELVKPQIKVGRDLTNDLVIQDPEVSRFHARLNRTATGYILEDLNSTNGTAVNGKPLHGAHVLEPNDVIKLGSMVQLQFIHQDMVPTDRLDPTRPRKPDAKRALEETLANVFANGHSEEDTVPQQPSRLGTGVEPGTLLDSVFISYGRKDWELIVAPLMVAMQAGGLGAWVDQYLAQGSKDWMAAVELALRECWMMVIVWSKEAAHSNYVKIQYRYFLQHDKPLVILACDETPIPPELGRARSVVYDQKKIGNFHKIIYEIISNRRQRGMN
jgi:pSer/pThr/pTyr-binding forkhead associated (FHA) protein